MVSVAFYMQLVLAVVVGSAFANSQSLSTADQFINLPFVPRASSAEYLNMEGNILDPNGVLLKIYRNYGGSGTDVEAYNPAFIANYALTACVECKKEPKQKRSLDVLQKQLKWLWYNRVASYYQGKEYWIWPYTFRNNYFNADAPWLSAFAQGLVGAAFMCASTLYNPEDNMAVAARAFAAFTVPMAQGGVTTFNNDWAWFEEVASADMHSSKVLNGHITALQTVWAYKNWMKDDESRKLFEAGVRAVAAMLPAFDAGFISYYSQFPIENKFLAGTAGYNTLHVHQLGWLYEQTGDSLFLAYALKFAQYEQPSMRLQVSGSTNAETNGPGKLSMQLGGDYWSSNQFPAWILADLGDKYNLDGWSFLSDSLPAVPMHFRIRTSIDGQHFNTVHEETVNKKLRYTHRFPPREVRYVRMEIYSDNGNMNVALQGVYAHRFLPNPSAVSDPTSFNTINLPGNIFGSGWVMPDSGWLVLDLAAKAREKVELLVDGPIDFKKVQVRVSRSLTRWNACPIEFGKREEQAYLIIKSEGARYIRLTFADGKSAGRKIRVLHMVN
jgi:hypothetical protein